MFRVVVALLPLIVYALAAQPSLAQTVPYSGQLSHTAASAKACEYPDWEWECDYKIDQDFADSSPWTVESTAAAKFGSAWAMSEATAKSQRVKGSAKAVEMDAWDFAGAVAVAEWGGLFQSNANLLLINWDLQGSDNFSNFLLTVGSVQDLSSLLREEKKGNGSHAAVIEPSASYFAFLSGMGGATGDYPSSDFSGIVDIQACPDSEMIPVKDLCVDGPCQQDKSEGYVVEVLLKCGKGGLNWGYRVKRKADGWIAGCYYHDGYNVPYLLKSSDGFRWINYKLDKTTQRPLVADVYTYNPQTDKVEKRRYDSPEAIQALKEALAQAIKDKRDPVLPEAPLRWEGDPPSDPDALAGVPLHALAGVPLPSSQRLLALAAEGGGTRVGRAAWIGLSKRTGSEWHYTLHVSEILGAPVSPENRIRFESKGIERGFVEGDAATEAYGGWRLVESEPGVLVFEATAYAYLRQPLSGFVAVGEAGAVKGAMGYATTGDWIGATGMVMGPTFTLQRFTLTVTKAGTGSGTVTSTPAGINCGATCAAPFDYNTSVTLTAAPAPGSTFTGWSGEGCSGIGLCTVTMTQARGVTATFTLQLPTVALKLNGSSFRPGDTLILNATTTPGATPRTVDAYVAIQFPDRTLLFYPSFTTTPQPVVSNWTVAPFSGETFRYTFNGGEPPGEYTWLGAFTEPGTLDIIGQIAQAAFGVTTRVSPSGD